ncbi:Isochorismate synthase [Fulvivirga imtechensis AK7]|uniref:isochorismate synthase n=1 Tax=Fulvivirga imtechensis AK7 TaxID=1237149 RepID=L8JZZ5_9BACT|nr:isochorismate synthase [Fulvivirga imtechensis]ELR73244.1 Isochorismate synthase [Fulvivirga imtechensis AK7]
MILTKNIKIRSAEQVISNAISYCQREGASIAVWRRPEERNIHFIVDFSAEMRPMAHPLESKIPGFVFSPFDTDNHGYLIRGDLHFDLEGNLSDDLPNYSLTGKKDDFLNYINSNRQNTYPAGVIKVSTDDTAEAAFKNLVKRSVDAIQKGQLQKVVPSRKQEITFEQPLNVGINFIRLAEAYPTAFVSLVFIPQTGLWLGATPELLISVRDNIFKTVALAGTQKYKEGTPLNNVAWTQKEIEEQALVSRYIINCFKKIRLREFDEAGPKTVVAGNLLHLKTEFKVDMVATNFPDLGDTMLKLLHPTSAICGMPLEPAKKFLKEHEAYDRGYFSGYLGPTNINNATELYVNLRCMHIEDSKATLFSGAGVTEDSHPDKEWQETEIKMNTLLNIIQ